MEFTPSLPPDLDRFVRDQLAAGHFRSEREVIHTALHLLEERAHPPAADAAWLKHELDRGLSSRPAEPATRQFWDRLRNRITRTRVRAMAAERTAHQTGLATADLTALADYYLRHAGPAVALRFLDSAERAFGRLVAMPRLGARLGLDELPYEDVRRWHVDGFGRLVILYREVGDGVEVVRVLDTARDIPALLKGAPS